MVKLLFWEIGFVLELNFSSLMSVIVGSLVEMVLILIVILVLYYFPESKFSLIFKVFFERMYEFFEEVLWKNRSYFIKSYVSTLFFVILFANIFWIIVDIVIYPFPGLENIISTPTWDMHFNFVLSVISVFMVLMIQFLCAINENSKHKDKSIIKKLFIRMFLFFYEYFPFWGRWILTMPKKESKSVFYYIWAFFVKIFDIIISLFLWFLDMIWIFAKIVSLTFRLLWNVVSWSILIWMVIVWLWMITKNLWGFQAPWFFPVFLYLQSMLIALIQAFVFALLVAVFIKVAANES